MTDTIPTPAEYRAVVEKWIAAAEKVREWNTQMEAVIDVVIDAAGRGRGVVISYSVSSNTIEAHASDIVPGGQAVIWNRDSDAVRPTHRTIRPEHLARRTL